jgi:hypothetical protein
MPWPVQTNSHCWAICQTPPAQQVSPLPLLQRRAPGVQLPLQAPLPQTYWQAEPMFAQVPCALHSCGCWAEQRRAPGLHSPAQTASPEHTNWQRVPGSQVPIGLQVSGMSPRQRFAPGMHEPAQEPLEQRFWQGVSAVH